jgi:hypothetical protein
MTIPNWLRSLGQNSVTRDACLLRAPFYQYSMSGKTWRMLNQGVPYAKAVTAKVAR